MSTPAIQRHPPQGMYKHVENMKQFALRLLPPSSLGGGKFAR